MRKGGDEHRKAAIRVAKKLVYQLRQVKERRVQARSAASKQARKSMRRLFDEAIKTGKAVPFSACLAG